MEHFSYFDIVVIAFFLISTYILIINLYTISSLRKEKKEAIETQKLLASLIGEIQGFFSQIDSSLNRLSGQEERLHQLIDSHQDEENHILKALESNQQLFLDRMDHIVNIEEGLLKQMRFDAQNREAPITPEILKSAMIFMQTQKRDLQLIKTKLDFLPSLSTSLESIEKHMADIERLLHENLNTLIEDFSHKITKASATLLNQIDLFNRSIKEEQTHFQTLKEQFANLAQSTHSLEEHIAVLKKSMIDLVEKSLDLSPVYKSLSELLEKMQYVFDDYHIAKGEMQELFNNIKTHKNKEFLYLRNDVNDFLQQIEEKINSAVEQLKQEYHLGQSQISDTVKTLSDRSLIKKAYSQE